MRQKIEKTVLENGVTVLTDEMPLAHSAALGAWIPRGSRHESGKEHGLSHFYEHLVFKGTQKRSAFEIASSIEARGGLLEAYTTRQETGFYAQVVPGDAPLALEVIADMLMHPTFSKRDVEKERSVVIEEIRSYEDIPEECAADLFNQIHFAGCGLSHPIVGTELSVKKLSEEILFKAQKEVMTELPIWVCGAGKIKHADLVKLAARFFAEKKRARFSPREIFSRNSGFKKISKPDLQQSSFVFGTSFPFASLSEKFKHSLSLFNIAFGACMSSRLFQKVREECGLAYSVYSTVDAYSDSFGFSLSLSSSPTRLISAAQISKDELLRFLDKGFEKGELRRAKKNILGAMTIGEDNTEKRLLRLAEHSLHFGECLPMSTVKKSLQEVSEEEILKELREVFFNSPWAASVVQPVGAQKFKFQAAL